MSGPTQGSESYASSTGQALTSIDWQDVHFQAMQPEYGEMLRWVEMQPGWNVLDAGCGTGCYLPLISELVGHGGRVSAIDLAPENVQVVEDRARQGRWPAPVDARVGTLLDLPYTASSFDAVWCANTTQYLTDDELLTALQEFRRVVRPGGLVAIKDYDITSFQVQPTTPMLAVHLMEARCGMGSQHFCSVFRTISLPYWLRKAGLMDVRQKPTMIVRLQPLRPVEEQYLRSSLAYFCGQAADVELPAEEARLWRELADLDSGEHIIHHPDFQYRCIQTVFVGRVP